MPHLESKTKLIMTASVNKVESLKAGDKNRLSHYEEAYFGVYGVECMV
jgi:hypothetical protein